MVTSLSYSEDHPARRLLTADDVRRLRQDELLVVSGNRRPVRAGRWCWRMPPQPAVAGALPVGAAVAPARWPGASLRDRLWALGDKGIG